MTLQLNDIHKSFGGRKALDGVTIDVKDGETTAILGPSGCGKSTVLNVAAGLIEPDKGEVLWNGRSLRGVPPHRRGFGLMFQDFALFPHMNVYDNAAFGLKMEGRDRAQIRAKVEEMLKLVDLEGFGERDVNTLSGGEQQRVALARSLAPNPKLLMLDEPLGALDRTLRERLILDLKRILEELNQTAVYVTHDQEEAFSLADRVVVMNAGRVEQTGTPQEIYRRPASLFVARFLGLENLIEGRVVDGQDGRSVFESALGRLSVPNRASGEGVLLVRPDAVRIVNSGQGGVAENGNLVRLSGRVVETTFRGASTRIAVDVDGGVRLAFELPSRVEVPAKGERIELGLEAEEGFLLF